MLGSLQKYKPAKRPSPYDKDQSLVLQGLKKQGGGTRMPNLADASRFTRKKLDDSIYTTLETNP